MDDPGPAPDASARYRTVIVDDGVAKGPLVGHFYDLGPGGGFRLVGVERPDSAPDR